MTPCELGFPRASQAPAFLANPPAAFELKYTHPARCSDSGENFIKIWTFCGQRNETEILEIEKLEHLEILWNTKAISTSII